MVSVLKKDLSKRLYHAYSSFLTVNYNLHESFGYPNSFSDFAEFFTEEFRPHIL